MMIARLSLMTTLVLGVTAAAQGPAPAGTVERITVHGASLEGNLEGDTPDRQVSVYLPPGYPTAKNQRYPVIYLLHGFTDTDDRWFGRVEHFINVPQVSDRAVMSGAARGMIVVMPNAYTKFAGSMYSSSATIGDWERFVAHDLVAYVDSHYRTLPARASRGLAGHSMGGYGTLRIAMKYPEVFAAIYALSPCCLSPNLNPAGRDGAPPKAEAITSYEEAEKADFGTKAQLASAAAWSPNPKKPPFFMDLPTHHNEPQPMVVAKWAANSPLAMLDQYLPGVRRLKAIAFDAGDKDEPIASTIRTLDNMLTAYDVPHTFEIYQGDHVNHIAERVEQKMLPFFSSHLAFTRSAAASASR